MHQAPRPDHRHTLQHCQMADEAQFRRMAALGICANLFANHIYYWGDQHYAITMGPDRATRIDATGTAERLGVHYAIHSDAPVTPLAPLFTAWCAVNRRTMSGRLLGEAERLTVPQALHAITIGAAYTLKLDHLVGSLSSRASSPTSPYWRRIRPRCRRSVSRMSRSGGPSWAACRSQSRAPDLARPRHRSRFS